MTNVAGHLREQNGMYQMILSWKDTDEKRRTKSISTGLSVKGNKKELNLCCVKHKKSLTLKRCSRFPTCRYRNI